jgi:nucleoside-diphosphate-sugar epimerase
VGSAFVARARELLDVRCVTRSGGRPGDITWDISVARDNSLPPVDCVVHIASLTARERPDPTPAELYQQQNVGGTRNLLEALSSKPAYFLYVSTADVYGQDYGDRISEATQPRPSGAYAASKLEAEQTALDYCASRGIPCGVARLGLIYGPGEVGYKKVIPSFIELALGGDQIRMFGEGRAKRHFLYIDDLVSALLLMVRIEFEGVLNVVGATVTSVGELADLIVELVGPATGVERVPMDGPERDVLFDTSHLASLGFVEAVGLRDGLQRQIEWQRSR